VDEGNSPLCNFQSHMESTFLDQPLAVVSCFVIFLATFTSLNMSLHGGDLFTVCQQRAKKILIHFRNIKKKDDKRCKLFGLKNK